MKLEHNVWVWVSVYEIIFLFQCLWFQYFSVSSLICYRGYRKKIIKKPVISKIVMSDFILVQFIIISLHAAATVIWRTLVEPEPVTHTFFSLLSFSGVVHTLLSTKETPSLQHMFHWLSSLWTFSWFFFSRCLFSRLVHSGPGKSSPLLDCELSFGLRSGTKQGVETHVFRVDSSKDLSTWTHLLVEGCHNAAELIKEVKTGACVWSTLSPTTVDTPLTHFIDLFMFYFFNVPAMESYAVII